MCFKIRIYLYIRQYSFYGQCLCEEVYFFGRHCMLQWSKVKVLWSESLDFSILAPLCDLRQIYDFSGSLSFINKMRIILHSILERTFHEGRDSVLVPRTLCLQSSSYLKGSSMRTRVDLCPRIAPYNRHSRSNC